MKKVLVKKIIDGKTYYEEASLDEAIREKQNGGECVFVDEDPKGEEEYSGNQTYHYHNFQSLGSGIQDLVDSSLKAASDALKSVGQSYSSFDSKKSEEDKDTTKDPKAKKILSILPFMDDEDIKEFLIPYLNGELSLEDLPIVSMMPFLDDESCSEVFLKVCDNPNSTISISGLLPFVPEECLSVVVDGYINGKYQHLNMDIIYPFLDSKDVKKLFRFILSKK